MRDHLMLCGNKTDQCPKCRKLVRRAIFAYHFENECADLDAFDEPASDRSQSSSTRHRDNLSQSSSRPAAGGNKYERIMVNNLEMQPHGWRTASYEADSGRL
jgi:hypothetical protein